MCILITCPLCTELPPTHPRMRVGGSTNAINRRPANKNCCTSVTRRDSDICISNLWCTHTTSNGFHHHNHHNHHRLYHSPNTRSCLTLLSPSSMVIATHVVQLWPCWGCSCCRLNVCSMKVDITLNLPSYLSPSLSLPLSFPFSPFFLAFICHQ